MYTGHLTKKAAKPHWMHMERSCSFAFCPGPGGWLPRRARPAVLIASPSRWILPDDFRTGRGLRPALCDLPRGRTGFSYDPREGSGVYRVSPADHTDLLVYTGAAIIFDHPDFFAEDHGLVYFCAAPSYIPDLLVYIERALLFIPKNKDLIIWGAGMIKGAGQNRPKNW